MSNSIVPIAARIHHRPRLAMLAALLFGVVELIALQTARIRGRWGERLQ